MVDLVVVVQLIQPLLDLVVLETHLLLIHLKVVQVVMVEQEQVMLVRVVVEQLLLVQMESVHQDKVEMEVQEHLTILMEQQHLTLAVVAVVVFVL
tara:strand:- start:38 stop:322 length:285 start_codon:yes stop_codon:yes gene_type:complete